MNFGNLELLCDYGCNNSDDAHDGVYGLYNNKVPVWTRPIENEERCGIGYELEPISLHRYLANSKLARDRAEEEGMDVIGKCAYDMLDTSNRIVPSGEFSFEFYTREDLIKLMAMNGTGIVIDELMEI
jgi:hypothetical protein